MGIELTEVSSSNIESMGYDPEVSSMYVKFLHGGLYEYKRVPQETYDEVFGADSVGGALNRLVKTTFDFERLE